MPNIDIGTLWRALKEEIGAPQKLRKSVLANRLYEMEFVDKLDTGESLAGTPTVVAEPAGPTIGSIAISGTKVEARISGGTDGKNHLVRFTADTSQATRLEATGRLYIRDK